VFSKNLKILCLYHKDVLVNTNFSPFFEIQCGKAESDINLPMQGDNLGENISIENKYWSEITGLYWAWKNIEKVKYIGLCSYRRFFNFTEKSSPLVLTSAKRAKKAIQSIDYSQLDEIFHSHDILLPVPYTYAWNINSIIKKNYNKEDFELLEEYIKNFHPAYYDSYLSVVYDRNFLAGHNMFIMKWDDFKHYCDWVFDILFAMQDKIKPKDYPIHQIRVFGYMHELLLSVYVEKRKMRISHSQILWVNNDISSSRFNKISYRVACHIVFFIVNLISYFNKSKE
tara:strand:- start:22 stop:873 length:852 start_codon:yes stop_codon:yes gene_type:complete